MLRKLLIGILILVGIGIVAYIGWWIIILSAFGEFDKRYSVTELKENFEKNKHEIYELKRYFNEIVPNDKFVEIEFKNNNIISRFGIIAIDSTKINNYGSVFLEWDLKINTSRMDSVIQPIGWTRETLKTLKRKLDDANCIKIESGEPAIVGFKRSGMGMYSFIVFDKPISDSLKIHYEDKYILASDSLLLKMPNWL